MKNILIMVVAGVGLFSVTVVGMLAATGRLNHEGTKGIPIIHGLFPAGEAKDGEPEAGAADGAGEDPPTESVELRDDAIEKERNRSLALGGSTGKPRTDPQVPVLASQHPQDGETAAETEHRQLMEGIFGQGQYRAGGLFEFQPIPAGLDAQQINDMWQRAKAALEDAERRETALDAQERLLAVREQDLHDREEALAAKMKDVEAVQRQLEARIVQFNNDVKLVRPGDLEPFKSAARTLASMEPEIAAQVVQEWWLTESGQDRALKILSVMDNDAVDSIVAALPVQQQRDFLEKRLLLIREKEKR